MREARILGLLIIALILIAAMAIVSLLWPYLGDQLASNISLSLDVIFLMSVSIITIKNLKQTQEQLESAKLQHGEAAALSREHAEMFALSTRESEVLTLLVEGRSVPAIAKELMISQSTVKTHTQRIYRKMNVHSRDELIELVRNKES